MRNKCIDCKHFFVTWDQHAPRGCKIYNIKSKMFPSLVVAQSSKNKDCMAFEQKEKGKKAKSNY